MLLIKHNEFLDKFKLIMFIAVFTFFFIIAFPIYLLPKVLKNDVSETSIKYLENLSKRYPNNKEIIKMLIDKYIKLGFYDKAKNLINKLPNSFDKYYNQYLIDKALYISHRTSKSKLREDLLNMFIYANNKKEFEIVYKEAKQYQFYYIIFFALEHLNKPFEYINLAIYLKKYNKALEVLKNELYKKYSPYYLYKYLDIAMYIHKDKEAYKIAKKFYKKASTEKEFEKLVLLGIKFKDKKLVRYSAEHLKNNLKLKLQAYLFLKEYKKAEEIAYKLKDYKLLLQIYISKKNYRKAEKIAYKLKDYDTLLQIYISQKKYKKALKIAKRLRKYKLIAQIYMILGRKDLALKYFIKDGFRKNEKTIYSLAYELKKYDLMKQILKNRIKRGDYKALKDLNYIFIITKSYNEAERFYIYMYNKTKNDKFLTQLFYIYLKEKDFYRIKKLASLYKKIPLNIALFISDIYIDQQNYEKAYEVLKKADKTNDFAYLNRMYYVTYKLKKEEEAFYYANMLQNAKKTPSSILSFFMIYKDINKQKAFEYLKRNFIKRKDFEYWILKTAYDLKKYNFIINYRNPLNKTSYYYQILINSYHELKMYEKEKYTYLEAIKKYPQFKQQFFSFLIARKDKDIRNYLNEIKDKTTLYQAYLILGDRQKALNILKNIATNSYDIKNWIKYYYLNGEDEKLRYYIYKQIKEDMLFDKEILDFYFYALLKYGSYYQIRKTLRFIKEYNLDYHKYWLIYQNYKNGQY